MTKRMCSAMICGLLGYTVSASAQTGSIIGAEMRIPGSALAAPMSPNAAENLLFKRVEAVDWTDVTLEEVLDWLRDQGEGRVNIVPRWNHLGAEGVSRDSLVSSLQLNNTYVAEVLSETLEQLSEDGAITYHGVGNKLTLSTRGDFDRKLHTEVYDCTDILFDVPNFGEDAPLIDLQQAGQSSGGGGSGGGGGESVFQGAGSSTSQEGGDEEDQETEERMAELRELIEQAIAPESWNLSGSTGQRRGQAAGGGGRGIIRILDRSLVITNTIEVHEQIAGRFSFGG